MRWTQKDRELTFGVGYLGPPGLYASDTSCVLPGCVAGQRRSSPGLMLGLLFIVLSSHDETCGGRRSPLLFRSDLNSALDAYENAHSHICIDRVKTDERDLALVHQASRNALEPKALRTPISHTPSEYVHELVSTKYSISQLECIFIFFYNIYFEVLYKRRCIVSQPNKRRVRYYCDIMML